MGHSLQSRKPCLDRYKYQDKNSTSLNQAQPIYIIYYCSINGDKPNFTKNDEVIDTSDIPSITNRVENIYKSEKDPRVYRYLELGNGMKVTLIQ